MRVAIGARQSLALGVVAAALVTGCSRDGASGEGRGTVVIASAADADFLFPPLTGTSAGKAVTEQLFEPLAAVGDSLRNWEGALV